MDGAINIKKKEEILLIGDTLHDYHVARALDIDCLLVAQGHQSEQVLQQAPVKIIKSLKDILKELQ